MISFKINLVLGLGIDQSQGCKWVKKEYVEMIKNVC